MTNIDRTDGVKLYAEVNFRWKRSIHYMHLFQWLFSMFIWVCQWPYNGHDSYMIHKIQF